MPNRYCPPYGFPDMKYLRLKAKRKKMPWKYIDLPRKLKDKCIAYCIREGDTFRIGYPSKDAIIFVFPDRTIYDISLLLHEGHCWRKAAPASMKWIKEHTT